MPPGPDAGFATAVIPPTHQPAKSFFNYKLSPYTIYPDREAIESLLYISNSTQHDLTPATNFATRFYSAPTSQNVLNVKEFFAA